MRVSLQPYFLNDLSYQFNEEISERIKEEPSYEWREEFLLLGTDVVSLFPSLSAERTGLAVRRQVEKSEVVWSEIDFEWLALYVHLNSTLCSNLNEIEKFLPKRRRGLGSE